MQNLEFVSFQPDVCGKYVKGTHSMCDVTHSYVCHDSFTCLNSQIFDMMFVENT